MKTYQSLPLALTTKEVISTLKSRRLFLRALTAGWIKPHIRGNRGRTSIFKGEDVQTLWQRLGREQPPLLPYEQKSTSAFSLPELMGCIAIITILAGTLIPSMSLNRCATVESTAKRELQTLNGAYQNYVAAGGAVLPANAPVEEVYSAVKGKVGAVGPFLIREGNLPTFETCTGPKEVVWTVNGFATPTPTPEPTATPAVTATATPSPTPTASPTPAPTATPSPTPTATPAPTPLNYTVALALSYRGIALPDVVTADVVLTNQTASPTSATVSFTASTGLATLGTSEPTAVVSGSGFTWSGNLTASGTKTIKVYLWPSNAGRFFMAASSASGQTATDEGEAWDPQAVAYAVFQTANGARSLGYLNGWSVAGASGNGNYGGGYSWKDGAAGAIQQMLAGATWPQNPTPGIPSVTLVAPPELTAFPSSVNAMPQPASYKTGLTSFLYSSVNSGSNPSTPPDNLKFRPGDWSWPGWGVTVPGRTIKQSVATGWSANYVPNGTLPYGVQNYRQVRTGYASPYQ